MLLALKLVLVIPIAYLAILVAVFAAQTKLLFPAGMVGGAGPLPPGAERLIVQTETGEQLHGVHIQSRLPGEEKLLVLGFGGNAWNAEAAAEYLSGVYPEADVVAFHYRGYAPSTGTPSAAALLQDAPLIHDEAKAMLQADRVVAAGFSIGSGVAARLAAERSLAGIILVTPFDSLAEVARGHYPWLPVRRLFRHEMAAAEDIARTEAPVAILTAGRDTIIPPARAEALRRVVPNLVFERSFADAGHNDLYHRPEFRDAMADALQRITKEQE